MGTGETSVVGILGNGEIGSSLHRVYQMAGYSKIIVRDPFVGLCSSLEKCNVVNICIPFFSLSEFITAIKELRLPDGCIIIIQSTIAMGSTDQIQKDLPSCVCVHSPVRGVHPNLTEGMLAFEKYVGVSDKYFTDKDITQCIYDHVLSLKMKPVMCRSKESELAKMVSTTLYGVNIAAITDVYKMCEKYDTDFGTVFTRWQTGYNKGYTDLGMQNVCRPVLTPVPEREDGKRVIGGHCVLPNCVILKNMGDVDIADFVLRYSDEEGLKHVTGTKH